MPARQTLLAALMALALTPPAAATTLNEPATNFGGWNAPTQIAAGVDAVTGTGNVGQFDHLAFTGLPSGAQTLTFTFAAPAGIGFSYAAGGQLLYSTTPFSGDYYSLTGPVTTFGFAAVNFANPTQTLSLVLGAAFSGTLYVAMNFTYGTNLQYSLAVPSNALPAAVPLPATGLLLLGGLAGLGLAARRRRGRAPLQS